MEPDEMDRIWPPSVMMNLLVAQMDLLDTTADDVILDHGDGST